MLSDKQQRLTEEFSFVEDAQERLALVVDRSRGVTRWNDSERTDEKRVHGCVSAVWLDCKIADGFCQFRADADSPIVRALVLFLCSFYSGATPADVALSPIDPFDALAISEQLTPTRRNGLHAVQAVIRAYAQSQAS